MSKWFALDGAVTCSCGQSLAPEILNRGDFSSCERCSTQVLAYAFPALHRPIVDGDEGEQRTEELEAACFDHADRRAVVACVSCGRFLCALCDIDLDGTHLCPACVGSGRDKGKLTRLEHRRVLYDSIALSTAILPLLVFYLTIFTAPVAIYIAARHWNSPTSILPRTRIRFVIAIAFASLQLVGWVALAAYVVAR